MDTMLGTAAPNPQWQYEIEPFPQARKPLPFDKNYADAFYKDAPIWSFDGPRLTSSGIEVKDVRCKARGMDNMQMPVMESIEWPPVVVNSILYGEKITLPLKNDFFLRSRYVERGSINIGKPSGGQSLNTGFWQLPAKIDQSFEMVFGYEIPVPLPGSALAEKSSMSSAVKPLSTAELSSPCLFPIPICSVFPTDPGNSSIATLRVPPLRIVVVFSLVCCKERYDFIPHGLVGTARLYPLVMVIASSPLDSIVGSVKLARPAKTMHTEVMDEQMTPDIGGAFYTDRNASLGHLPIWSEFFDYYYVDPLVGKYTMATPSDRGITRTIRNGVTARGKFLDSPSLPRDIKKLPGQGEFDNFHLAPKMVLPRDVIDSYPELYGLDGVAMAPYCIHDCFHMHLRWSSDLGDVFNRGWAGQKPYARAGAPLVPGNQGVTVELLSATSFLYTASAERPAPGQWQIIMHHGGAYVVSHDGLATVAKYDGLDESVNDPLGLTQHPLAESSWAALYWHLRYAQPKEGGQVERLTWTPQQFAAARELSPSQTAEYLKQEEAIKQNVQKAVAAHFL